MPRKGTGAGGRPPKPPGEHRVQIGVRLPPDIKDKLDRLAESRGETPTKVIENLISKEPEN